MTRRSEFDLIAAVRARMPGDGPRVVLGSGDDAAVVRAGGSHSVISIDTTIDGIHARLDLGDPVESAEAFGWRALTTALSDLAAMGVAAGEAYVALTLPASMDDDRVLAIAEGLGSAASQFGCSIVGGDVSAGPVAALSVTVVGWASVAGMVPGERPRVHRSQGYGRPLASSRPVAPAPALLTRAGAHPGDLLGVTGPIGASGAGLALLVGDVAEDAIPPQDVGALREAYRRPVPQLEAGVALLAAGATAAIDLSDGLIADAAHLATASGVALRLVAEHIPVHPAARPVALQLGQDPLRFAATAGEDFALLVTVPPRHRALAESAGVTDWIGTVAIGHGVTIDGLPADDLRHSGHDHRAT